MTDHGAVSPASVGTPTADAAPLPPTPSPTEVTLYSHSPLFYWWPVWVVGYALAGLTWWFGEPHTVGESTIRLHPSSLLGLGFFLALFLVIVITNVSVRGKASLVVVLGGVTLALLFLLVGWWQSILGWFGDLNVYLNQGGYFWFSTLLFVVWAGTVFGVDRLSYWRVTAGQLTHRVVFGAASQSYPTRQMVLEKRRDDVFRHSLLGLGSGDLRIRTRGPDGEDILIPNVLFVGGKLALVQQLIAAQPSLVTPPAGW